MAFSSRLSLPNFIRIPGLGTGNVLRTLRHLAAERTPVRVELENTDINFFTILDIRREKVVMSRPAGLSTQIKTGAVVRFNVPNNPKRALRLTVEVGDFHLFAGGPVFLCEIPREFAAPSKRSANRYNTSRFKNLLLVLTKQNKVLRIIDVSERGCKVYYGAAIEPDWITLDELIPEARIEIDNRVKMELESVVPRSCTKKTIGFEFQVSPAAHNLAVFSKFLVVLEDAEKNRLILRTE